MIILDTNVLSAVISDRPDDKVVRWLEDQPIFDVGVTAITIYELKFGISTAPDGWKRKNLEVLYKEIVGDIFQRNRLELDERAAGIAARLAADRKRGGHVVGLADILIAGITIANYGHLATRNVKDFQDLDINLIDPWNPSPTDPWAFLGDDED